MSLLEFEAQLLFEILHEDCLLIVGKGMGLERTLISLLQPHADPGNLVLVIGTSPQEDQLIIEECQKSKVDKLPEVVTADVAVSKRHHLYMSGGVLLITPRILVVDLLLDRVPVDL